MGHRPGATELPDCNMGVGSFENLIYEGARQASCCQSNGKSARCKRAATL